MKNLLRITFVVLCVAVFASFTATNSFGQSRGGEERGKRIELTENAKKNGYKIRQEDEEKFVRIINVINPFNNKPLEGLQKIFCQYTEEGEVFEKFLGEAVLSSGSTIMKNSLPVLGGCLEAMNNEGIWTNGELVLVTNGDS